MKKITALVVQKKNPNRVNVYLDGEFAFGLARIAAACLKTGDALDEEKIQRLLQDDLREKAYQQAMLFLSYRARSEKEICDNLRKHEIPAALIDSTLERLRRANLANDAEFARAWVENRGAFRPRSKRALTMELRQKGLEDEAIRESLADVDESALAYEAARKRVERYRSLAWEEFRKKVGEFLARRGFSYPTAAEAVSRLWRETRGDLRNHEDEEHYESSS